jgi:HD superfamily phosphohydrolase
MADPQRRYEFPSPVHGFITINKWEREIISQPALQRLRPIPQLSRKRSRKKEAGMFNT